MFYYQRTTDLRAEQAREAEVDDERAAQLARAVMFRCVGLWQDQHAVWCVNVEVVVLRGLPVHASCGSRSWNQQRSLLRRAGSARYSTWRGTESSPEVPEIAEDIVKLLGQGLADATGRLCQALPPQSSGTRADKDAELILAC